MSIAQLFQRAKELERQNREVIHLEVGELDLPIPASVRKMSPKARSHYSDIFGLPQLREAISRFLKITHGVDVNTDQILVTTGSRFAIFSAISTFVGKEGCAIVIDPSWPGYAECAEAAGVKLRRVHGRYEENWEPDVVAVEEAMKENARMLILNYPNNPTGKVLGREKLDQILDLARRYNVMVLSDEAYAEYSFTDFKSILHVNGVRSIAAFTFSKNFAMPGFRIGFAVSDPETIRRLCKVHSALLTSVSEFSQSAAMAALGNSKIIGRNRRIIQKRAELAASILNGLGMRFYPPDGGLYLFPGVDAKEFDSVRFSNKLLEERGVAVVPGTAFGDYPSFLRISLGTSTEKIRRGLELLGKSLKT